MTAIVVALQVGELQSKDAKITTFPKIRGLSAGLTWKLQYLSSRARLTLAPLPTSFRLIPALHFHHPPHQFRAPPSQKHSATPEIYITILVIQVSAPSQPIPFLCQHFAQGTTKRPNFCSEVNQFTSSRSRSSKNLLIPWAHQHWVACPLSIPSLI